MNDWNRRDWLIICFLAALVVLFYWPILTLNPADRHSFPPGDFHAQFWAFSTFEVRELSAGRLPLWNPFTFAGAPFWADVQAAVFYPPSLLTVLFSAPWGFSLFALELEAIAHIWLAGLFMYLFLRELTGRRNAAVIGSLTFAFSGYLTGYPSQQLAVLEADVWLPLILYFIYRAHLCSKESSKADEQRASQPGTRSPLPFLILAGVAWGLTLLAGHPQSALIVAYISLGYIIFLWADRSLRFQFGSHLLRLSFNLAIFLFTGLALAAIQFIPAVEYTLLSVRAEGTYDNMSGGFPITDMIQVLLPGQVSFYSPLYIGVAGLTLALWVIFAAPNRHILFWAGLAFVTFLISFGGNTFLYSPLYLIGPGFSIFRGQERWAFATIFSLSILAGYGFNRLLEVTHPPSESNNYPSLSTTLSKLTLYLFLFSLLLNFLFFFGLNESGWAADSIFAGLLSGSTLLTILLALTWLLWRYAARFEPIVLTALTTALICFDLFTANWQTNLYPQVPEWQTQQPKIVEMIQADAAQASAEPYRVYNEFRLYDNYGIPFEIEDLWGASPLRPDRYDKFLAPPMPIERTWELLNVKYVITWRDSLYLPSTVIYQEPAGDGTTYVHRLETVGPRAWLVNQAKVADDAAILQHIADPAFDRWQIALLEPDASPYLSHLDQATIEPTRDDPEKDNPAISISRSDEGPSSIQYQVDTPTPAFLILSEPHYPGWKATVDGQSVPLLRSHFVLRAVPVPSGQHLIRLTFQPLSFTIGATISLIAFTIIAGVLFMYHRRGLW